MPSASDGDRDLLQILRAPLGGHDDLGEAVCRQHRRQRWSPHPASVWASSRGCDAGPRRASNPARMFAATEPKRSARSVIGIAQPLIPLLAFVQAANVSFACHGASRRGIVAFDRLMATAFCPVCLSSHRATARIFATGRDLRVLIGLAHLFCAGCPDRTGRSSWKSRHAGSKASPQWSSSRRTCASVSATTSS